MIADIIAAEEAIARAVHSAGIERGKLPDGEKAELRYVTKQLKAAQAFVVRAKKRVNQ